MIGSVDIRLNAHRPQAPLEPMTAFAGSPSSVRISGVPGEVGRWRIEKVYVTA